VSQESLENTAFDDRNQPASNFSPRIYGIALLVSGIVVAGIWFISLFTSMDLARDMQTWQEKLNLISESRAAEVNKWVSEHYQELHSLADNPSLQLYLTELQTIDADAQRSRSAEGEPAQKAYLRNLLLFTADRGGYGTGSRTSSIPANVKEESRSGLVVLNNNNEVVVSTNMRQSTRDMLFEHAKQFTPGQDNLIDIQNDPEGVPYIGFSVPIFSIQGERDANSQIGRIVGIKTLDNSFYAMLKHPGATEETLEAVLIRAGDKKLEFISPLIDGTGAMAKQVDFDPEKSAESSLAKNTGDFVSEKIDYRNKKVLATSRPIAGTPWILVTKIDRKEALTKSDQRRSSMMVFFFLIIAIIVLIVIAVWWHAHSKRSMLMSYHFRRMAAQARAQESLLRLVADHQLEPIYIVDMRQIYQFANSKTASEAQMQPENIIGKTLNDVRGTARAEKINLYCEKAMAAHQPIYDVASVQEGSVERIIRSAYVPLYHIPVAALPDPTPGVLIVEQDITEVVHEREARINIHHQLVQTLVRLVDERDPFAADHSLLVSHIACEVAIDMGLDNALVETTRIAGSLMNIGKIVVPAELLTKTESLSAEEKNIIRDSMNKSAEFTKDIHFDGPVSETLRQWQEMWNGTGPLGLKGDQILVSARIIAASNAFIGMISPRSWRTAIPIESANKFLLDQCDTHFDRRVVVALINYVENHSGRAWLNQLLEEKKKAA
jgi:HD-GYP domain-containing protein (c-di-GMP phosphodiesterase class II)